MPASLCSGFVVHAYVFHHLPSNTPLSSSSPSSILIVPGDEQVKRGYKPTFSFPVVLLSFSFISRVVYAFLLVSSQFIEFRSVQDATIALQVLQAQGVQLGGRLLRIGRPVFWKKERKEERKNRKKEESNQGVEW